MHFPLCISPGEVPDASEILQVVLTGITVVFIGLIILIIFVWLFGKIFSVAKKKDSSAKPAPLKAAAPSAPATPTAPSAPIVSSSDNDEIVAVISAAVAAISADEGKSFRIHSITPSASASSTLSQWSAAGLLESTRPF